MPADDRSVVVANPWDKLRRYTPARIALGRAGVSLPTAPHLAFQLAHARARKAVHHDLDAEALRATLTEKGRDAIVVHSRAASRAEYLQRPDHGRRLDEESRRKLESVAQDATYDIAIVIGDGLSALAIEENAVAFLDHLLPSLEAGGWRIAPLVVVKEARVAIGDEIGEIFKADLVAVLIGERPGLSSPDSMGVYMTWKPRVGLTDESRNCISNVRPEGLAPEAAAHKLLYLLGEARKRRLSGVHLKDETEAPARVAERRADSFLIEKD